MKSKIGISIVHDTRRQKKDGTYPVKLRVTYKSKQKYFPTPLSLTISDFEKSLNPKAKKEARINRILLNKIETEANLVVESLPHFTFAAFEKMLFAEERNGGEVWGAFKAKVNLLESEGRISSANNYFYSMASLKDFAKGKKLNFSDITVKWLNDYEKWMQANGKSSTTIGMYLRNFRALFNEAIEKGDVLRDYYPFGRYKYVIPSGRNVKKALTLEEVGRIFKYKAIPGTKEAWARDIWIFSYLANGMNMKDIFRLRYRNLDGDRLEFIRAKTARSKKGDLKPIVAILPDRALEVIRDWGAKPRASSNLIFEVLHDGVSPKREQALIQQATKTVNKYMARIAASLDIEKKATTYVARHSFATVMKRSGANTEHISEALGHSSLRTTQNYLDSFVDEQKREFSKALLNFS